MVTHPKRAAINPNVILDIEKLRRTPIGVQSDPSDSDRSPSESVESDTSELVRRNPTESDRIRRISDGVRRIPIGFRRSPIGVRRTSRHS